jgi:hypothetical protein
MTQQDIYLALGLGKTLYMINKTVPDYRRYYKFIGGVTHVSNDKKKWVECQENFKVHGELNNISEVAE